MFGGFGVAFLNASIDTNREGWKRKLAEEHDWAGTNIILSQREAQNFTNAYKRGGIPRYLLIDQSGRIVSAAASTPSSETIREEIRSLLPPK